MLFPTAFLSLFLCPCETLQVPWLPWLRFGIIGHAKRVPNALPSLKPKNSDFCPGPISNHLASRSKDLTAFETLALGAFQPARQRHESFLTPQSSESASNQPITLISDLNSTHLHFDISSNASFQEPQESPKPRP